jgi:27-O-demethylrifamycin SV methyltransferase
MLKLRKTQPSEPLISAMTAVRSGDRLLIVGCGVTKVITQLAAKPGIAGRACAVDASAERTARAAAAAEHAGALLEVETAPLTALPFDCNAFDVVVINHIVAELDAGQRVPCVAEAARVVRSGGRCVVVQAARGNGLAGLFGGGSRMTSEDVEAVLSSAGLKAVRIIAERDGLMFVEGAKRAG